MENKLRVDIHPHSESDSRWMLDLVRQRWGSKFVVSRKHIHDIEHLPGFIAWHGEERVGLVTYKDTGSEIEIVTLDSLVSRVGIGTALISHMKNYAARKDRRRLWLITTNDNTEALRFYQMQGFTLSALHRNAIEHSRSLKPEIPEIGLHGIPIRDELELEFLLPR